MMGSHHGKGNRKRILRTVLLALTILFTAVVVGSLSFSLLQKALHLDFSQDYRQVEGNDKILFRENGSHKMYTRSFWGLRPTGQKEEQRDVRQMWRRRKRKKQKLHGWMRMCTIFQKPGIMWSGMMRREIGYFQAI